MPSTDTIILRTFQALGVTVSAFFAGKTFGYSAVSVPMIQIPGVSTALATKQWLELYNLGKPLAIGCTVLSVLSNSYVLYRARTSWPLAIPAPNEIFLLGAIIVQASFVVYTGLVMEQGVNKRLSLLAAQAHKGGLEGSAHDETVRKEVQNWQFLHSIRVLMPAGAAVLGFLSIFV